MSDTFIKKAKTVHGDLYDYSKINYVNSQIHVTIICATHGEFSQTPNNHLRGKGCKKCANQLLSTRSKKTTEQFIHQAKEIHGDTYDYSNVVYTTTHKNVSITCKIHGDFPQAPSGHLSGSGCNKCSILKRALAQTFTKDTFIKRAKTVHGDAYDYSKVIYVNSQTYVTIICNTCAIEFSQVPNSHLQGTGCDKCAHRINHDSQRLTEDEIKLRAKQVHGDKYDYSLMNYKNSQTTITIICTLCSATFHQLYGNHVTHKQGCPFCYGRYMDTTLFIEKARQIHGIEFDYSKVVYVKSNIKVTIICNKTKVEFSQTPNSHLIGSKCACCSPVRYSRKAIQYLDFMASYYKIHIQHKLNGGELYMNSYYMDGFAQEINTIYEFNGTVYHGDPRLCDPTQNNHYGDNYGELYKKTLKKEQFIKDAGYKLVVMWEHDWNNALKCVKKIQKIFRKNRKILKTPSQ